MLRAIYNTVSRFVSARARAPSSAEDDCELSSPGFIQVAALLGSKLTDAQREEFVNDYVWVASDAKIARDLKTDEKKEFFHCDAVMVKLVRFKAPFP